MARIRTILDWPTLDYALDGLPLCVDLDGTLIHGHSLWQLDVPFKMNQYWPLSWPLIKTKIASHLPIDGGIFMYYRPLIAYLCHRRKMGQKIFLVTGSPQVIAQAVVRHLDVFDGYYASSCDKNLVSHKKADHLSSTFGPFAYIGNSWKDLPVWRAAQKSICVAHSSVFLQSFLKRWNPSLFFI